MKFVTSFVGVALTADPAQISGEKVDKVGIQIPSPSEAVKQTLEDTNTPTIKPTFTITPTKSPSKIITPTIYIPPTVYIAPTNPPVQNTGGSWTCNCSLTCGRDIVSCEQAQYLLNVCGCSARDADHDGIACDSAPLNCQN